jgi:hypothetical protein
MSRLGAINARFLTDYRQDCIRNLDVQNQIKSQLNLKNSVVPHTTISVESSRFLQENAQIIRDTDRNKSFNTSKYI